MYGVCVRPQNEPIFVSNLGHGFGNSVERDLGRHFGREMGHHQLGSSAGVSRLPVLGQSFGLHTSSGLPDGQ